MKILRASLLSLFASASCVTLAHAGPVGAFNQVYAGVGYTSGAGNVEDEKKASGAGPQSVSVTSTAPVIGSAYAYADSGVLKARSSVTVPASGTTPPHASASASWQQTIQFIDPALTGTKGTAFIRQYYHSEIDSTVADGYSLAMAQNTLWFQDAGYVKDAGGYFASVGSLTTQSGVFSVGAPTETFNFTHDPDANDYDLSAKPVAAPDDYLYLPIEFEWGKSYEVGAFLVALCSQIPFSAGTETSCLVDSSHSSYWAGVSDVRDASGALVGDYRLLTAGGEDFSASLVPTAVPEPHEMLLLLTGLAGMAAARRARRRA